MHRLQLALATVALSAAALPASAQSPTLSCPPRWAKAGKPLVASADTARAIFLAVEKEFFPQADKVRFPDIEATDEGKYWSVLRSNPPKPQPNGDLIVTAGGGQLSMRVGKCDGKISHVHFTR